MKYTIDDIPYLIGLHFRLKRDGERKWDYLIHSYYDGHVFIDWPHRYKGEDMADYDVETFLNYINDTWIITDLPTVDISSVIKETINESNDAVKERGIILKFDPRPTSEQEEMIYDRLTEMFPGIKWSSGNKLNSRSYSSIKLNTIFIDSRKSVTWGTGNDAEHEMKDTPNYWELYDGWDYVNGTTTSEIFDTLYKQLYESENDYSFLRTQDILGLQFYHPTEYEETGIFYTIVDDDGEELKIKWEGAKGSLEWDDFIGDLNRGFYFIKDDNIKTTIDNFNRLFESEGVRTIHVGDNVYVPSWEQIGTILDISGRSGIYKKITEIKPGECTFGVVFHIRLNETGRWVYLSRGQFEFSKMSSDDAFSKLYESEEDFEWAKQLINTPITLGYLWEKDALVKGDEIALYGEVRDSKKLLFNLTGEEFKVDRVTYKRDVYSGNGTGEIDNIILEWLASLSDRPNNWRTASTGNYFLVHFSTIGTDGILRVKYITPPQENLKESEEDEFEWARDITPPSNVDQNLWVVLRRGHYYPENITLWDYFNIPGVRECIIGQDRSGEPQGDRKCIDELYKKGILVIPDDGDECYHDTKLWTEDIYFADSLPVHHMIRVKDGGHFVMTNQGVKPIK